MKLIYFAWVRERVGLPEERIDLPDGVQDVSGLLAWLQGRGENYAHAFEKAPLIRVAINKKHVRHDATLAGAEEIAFFPPMTGG